MGHGGISVSDKAISPKDEYADLNPKRTLIERVLIILNLIAQNNNGGGLGNLRGLLPLNVNLNSNNEFEKGALAAVLHIYFEISQSDEGRQAIKNLGFEPLFENIESPRSGGRNES